MLGRALHWLTGRQAGARTGDDERAAGHGRGGASPVVAAPASGAARPAASVNGAAHGRRVAGQPAKAQPATAQQGAALGAAGAEPQVFSSRAVRDGAVVNATLDALRRFADGAEPADALARRLAGLSAEQATSLQISAEAAVLQRAIARAADLRGSAVAELNRLLAELAGGARPRREAAGGGGVAGGVYGPRSVFGPLPRPPGPLAEPSPSAAGLTGEVGDFLPEAVPLPQSLERDSPPMPAPAPPPKGVGAGVPRLPRGAADARRSRLAETLAAALPPESRPGPRPESHALGADGTHAAPANTLPPREDAR